jgi:hypothetical protein
MLNRIEEHIFGHGRRESFGYPIERTRIVAPDVSFGVAPTYLDNRHDLNVIPCYGSANMCVSGKTAVARADGQRIMKSAQPRRLAPLAAFESAADGGVGMDISALLQVWWAVFRLIRKASLREFFR